MTSPTFRFSLLSFLSFLVLIGIEWMINKSVKIEHGIGWLVVAIFIGSLAFLIGGNRTKNH